MAKLHWCWQRQGTIQPSTARTTGKAGCHGGRTWLSEVSGERACAAAALTAPSLKPCGWEEGDSSVDPCACRGDLPGSGTHLQHRPILTSFLGCCRHSPHLTGNSQTNSAPSLSSEPGVLKSAVTDQFGTRAQLSSASAHTGAYHESREGMTTAPGWCPGLSRTPPPQPSS